MHLDFFILDIEYSPLRKAIVLYGKTPDDKKVCVLDSTFQFSFWIVPEDPSHIRSFIERLEEIRVTPDVGELYYVAKTEIHQKKLLGQEVSAIRIFLNEYAGLHEIKHEIKRIGSCIFYEDDFPPYRQYLIERKLTPLVLCTADGDEVADELVADITLKAKTITQQGETMIKHPKILAFDIEVYNEMRYPDDQKDPIIMIGLYGTDGYAKVFTWKSFSNPKKYIEFCANEEETLLKFKQAVRDYQPDYLVGYFSDGFDFPYIKKRCEKHHIKLDLSLNRSEVRFTRRGDNFSAKVVGIAHVDIYKFLKRVMGNTLDVKDFDLDSVAKALLGEGKTEVSIEELAPAWKNNTDQLRDFCEYNLTDARLTFRLTQIMLPNLHELVKLVGQPLYDVSRMSYGQLAEWYLIKEVQKFDELVPQRPRVKDVAVRRMQTYEGAYIFEPLPGLYSDIVVFDFRSLYPSVITAHNICPSTLTESDKDSHPTPEIEVKNKKIHYYFNFKRDGFIPTILKDVIQRRIRIKEIIKGSAGKPDPVLNARQDTLKILANSFYGYLGFSGARWYSPACAASITAYARHYIKEVIRKAQEQSFTVIYGDTDSVFISLKGKSVKEAMTFLRDVNHELPSLIEMEFQGFYPRGIFVMKKGSERGAKKKYALVNEQGEISITGFETIRGDWSVIAKEVQQKVFEIILRNNNPKEAFSYVQGIVQDIQHKKLPAEKMIIQKQLRKGLDEYESVGPHVAVATSMKAEGMPIGPGSVIEYIIEEGKGVLRDRARSPKNCKQYDAEYYIHNQVIPAIARIFEVLGFDPETLGQHEQSQLGDF